MAHRQRSRQRQRGRRHRKVAGFSLAELTIALAVVGLVISGLFAATSSAWKREAVHRAAQDVMMIVGQMRELYASRAIDYTTINSLRALNVTPTTGTGGDFEYYTDKTQTYSLINRDVFPEDMLTGNGVKSPWNGSAYSWGGDVAISLAATDTDATTAVVPGGPVLFWIEFASVPYDACMSFLPVAGVDGANFPRAVYVLNASGTSTSLSVPVQPGAVQAACGTSGNAKVDLVFSLGHGCTTTGTRC